MPLLAFSIDTIFVNLLVSDHTVLLINWYVALPPNAFNGVLIKIAIFPADEIRQF